MPVITLNQWMYPCMNMDYEADNYILFFLNLFVSLPSCFHFWLVAYTVYTGPNDSHVLFHLCCLDLLPEAFEFVHAIEDQF
jgi:hypothetical protein